MEYMVLLEMNWVIADIELGWFFRQSMGHSSWVYHLYPKGGVPGLTTSIESIALTRAYLALQQVQAQAQAQAQVQVQAQAQAQVQAQAGAEAGNEDEAEAGDEAEAVTEAEDVAEDVAEAGAGAGAVEFQPQPQQQVQLSPPQQLVLAYKASFLPQDDEGSAATGPEIPTVSPAAVSASAPTTTKEGERCGLEQPQQEGLEVVVQQLRKELKQANERGDKLEKQLNDSQALFDGFQKQYQQLNERQCEQAAAAAASASTEAPKRAREATSDSGSEDNKENKRARVSQH